MTSTVLRPAPTEGLVVVTGGATGIGLAIVRDLVDLGYDVLIGDVDEAAGRAVQAELGVDFLCLDVSAETDWHQVSKHLGDRRLIGLVNNAGIGGAGSVADESVDQWSRIVSVNQTGVFLGMRELGPRMVQQGGGSIVNLASIFSAGGGFGNAIAYHATKGAVAAMTKNAAVFWATAGVRVNSVHPGFVATPMTLTHQDLPVGDRTVGELVLGGTPMGRLAEPSEIAPVVEFLLSPRAAYVTGGEYFVDGGWNAH